MDLAELHGNSDQASLYDGDEVKLSEKVDAFCIVTLTNGWLKSKGQEKIARITCPAGRARWSGQFNPIEESFHWWDNELLKNWTND